MQTYAPDYYYFGNERVCLISALDTEIRHTLSLPG